MRTTPGGRDLDKYSVYPANPRAEFVDWQSLVVAVYAGEFVAAEREGKDPVGNCTFFAEESRIGPRQAHDRNNDTSLDAVGKMPL